MTNGLAEFLLARIAEDEHFGTHDHHLAKRWPAECAAKLRIVDEYTETRDEAPLGVGDVWQLEALERVLRLLALPYADHPDYREEWRP